MRLPLFVSTVAAVLIFVTTTNAFTPSIVLPASSSSFYHGTIYKGNSRCRHHLKAKYDVNSSNDEEEEDEATKDISPSSSKWLKTKNIKSRPASDTFPKANTMDRRDTIFSLAGTGVSFAVSDIILGKLGAVVGSRSVAGKASTAVTRLTSMYSAKWNQLYQRVAAQIGKHGSKAVATPELAAWIAKSPAALAHPELRAWLAAQKAFTKVAVMEEGMSLAATAAAAAAAAVAGRTRKNDSQELVNDKDDVIMASILETTTKSETDSMSLVAEADNNLNLMEDGLSENE
mgnify:CR=1 FL=1